MPEAEQVEILVLGSGIGGKQLAWYLASQGHKTVVVERRWIGGSCNNINCLPSKNEIKSAEVADAVHHAPAYGTMVSNARTDMAQVVARKRKMVERLVSRNLDLYRGSNTELILGEARFTGPKTMEVALNDGGTRRLKGDKLFLNLGTRAFIPPIPGLAPVALTNIELLELDRLPEHLLVLGGGYVGLEFAQAFRRFGSRVTVVERGPHVLAREDPDVAQAMQRLLADEEVDVLLNAETLRVDGRRGALSAVVRTGGRERTIDASEVLVAMGRLPNTKNIGLDLAGVELDARGFLAVNDRLETSAPDVWAIGEGVSGNPQFTHVSNDDFRVIRDNLQGKRHSTRGRLVPFCLFTDPQLARVGLNEVEARSRGIKARIATLPVEAIQRTAATGQTRGFLKALVDAQSDQILGFTMFGADAGEVMTVVQTAMLGRMPYTTLRDAIYAHPTMSEGLNALFEKVAAR